MDEGNAYAEWKAIVEQNEKKSHEGFSKGWKYAKDAESTETWNTLILQQGRIGAERLWGTKIMCKSA